MNPIYYISLELFLICIIGGLTLVLEIFHVYLLFWNVPYILLRFTFTCAVKAILFFLFFQSIFKYYYCTFCELGDIQ